ncbi:MAG: ATP cone domain-containing protein [Bacillota bacterium]
MKVQKSDGNMQEFNIEKIMLVIGRVSDECKQSLTLGDIRAVSNAVQKILRESYDEVVLYSELRQIISNTLTDHGFDNIAIAFMRGRENGE